uniref:Uncharacterized protein n=1 Tax=Kalanchoe fedtschenkoi TaxID=63787 RepID=A0A7N0V5J8_KALFE
MEVILRATSSCSNGSEGSTLSTSSGRSNWGNTGSLVGMSDFQNSPDFSSLLRILFKKKHLL